MNRQLSRPVSFAFSRAASYSLFHDLHAYHFLCLERQHLADGTRAAVQVKGRLAREVVDESQGLAVQPLHRLHVGLKERKALTLNFRPRISSI